MSHDDSDAAFAFEFLKRTLDPDERAVILESVRAGTEHNLFAMKDGEEVLVRLSTDPEYDALLHDGSEIRVRIDRPSE